MTEQERFDAAMGALSDAHLDALADGQRELADGLAAARRALIKRYNAPREQDGGP